MTSSRTPSRSSTPFTSSSSAPPRSMSAGVGSSRGPWVIGAARATRSAYRHPNTAEGRKVAEKVLASFPSCPIPEIARLGRTLKRWRHAFLAYFDTNRSNNGGTEAMNGLIELHRRVARGFRNRENYRLRMLLIGGGLSSPHLR